MAVPLYAIPLSTVHQRRRCTELYETLETNSHKYGRDLSATRNPCVCYKYEPGKYITNTITATPPSFPRYVVGFADHYGYIPRKVDRKKGNEISHICGRSICIEGTHMILEKHKANQRRIICHNYIRAWEYKCRNRNVSTTGWCTVNHVNKMSRRINLEHPWVEEGFLDQKLKCKCNKKCFIIYGKI